MGRFVVFSGTPPGPAPDFHSFPTTSPTAGGPVDGCTGTSGTWGPRWGGKGTPIHVEAGGTFSQGDDLATDDQGRAVQAGAGDEVVARALEGAVAAGVEVWAVMR